MSNTPSRMVLPEPEKTTVFKPGADQDSRMVYRIPSLIYLQETHTYLAFAEKRNSKTDEDAKCLVMSRGTGQNGSIQWSEVEELTSASLPHHRTMNPCPVFERNTKSLFLFFICVLGNTSECWQIFTGKNKARLCYVTSSDYGRTWSQVEDVTSDTVGDTVNDWATFAVGPGHGLQLESGRLVIPTHAQLISGRCCSIPFPLTVKPHALAVYSDDSGKTWHLGETLPDLSGECEMAEIHDRKGGHQVYCNARTTGGHRREALSKEGGTTFHTSRLASQLVETGKGCQGSVVGFPAPEAEAGGQGGPTSPSPDSVTWLLYSHPTDKSDRKDVGVYLNRTPLEESGWSLPWVIHSGPSAYSDLAYNEDLKTFACLLECGEKSELEQIAFVSFTLNDVIENPEKKKKIGCVTVDTGGSQSTFPHVPLTCLVI